MATIARAYEARLRVGAGRVAKVVEAKADSGPLPAALLARTEKLTVVPSASPSTRTRLSGVVPVVWVTPPSVL